MKLSLALPVQFQVCRPKTHASGRKARGMYLKRRRDINLIACSLCFRKFDDFISPCFEVYIINTWADVILE